MRARVVDLEQRRIAAQSARPAPSLKPPARKSAPLPLESLPHLNFL